MSDTPGDDTRATDPWGNPLPSGGQVPLPPPDPWGRPADPQAPHPAPPPGPGQPAHPGYPGYPGHPGQAPYPYQRPKTEGTAVGSLVCGILSLLCAGLCGVALGPAAVVLGIVARHKIDEGNGALEGRGMSTAGIVLGILGTVLSVAALAVVAVNPDILQDLVDRLTTTTTTTTPG